MKKCIIAVVTVLLFSTNGMSTTTETTFTSGNYPDCWAAADAAEINTCGSVGCNFSLWDSVYAACMGWED